MPRTGRRIVLMLTTLAVSTAPHSVHAQTSTTPTVANARAATALVEQLIAADRAFASASARTNGVAGISAMFSDGVMMPLPQGRFARGLTEARQALEMAADSLATARVDWTPIRGAISADGKHGFTFGYLTSRRPDGTSTAMKYMSYWVKQGAAWRVAAYKRSRTTPDSQALKMMAPLVPVALTTTGMGKSLGQLETELRARESEFSAEAQKVGLGIAFGRFGHADAVNMGPPTRPTFIVGADSIAVAVSRGNLAAASPVYWSADTAIVASSGDLGVTLGVIRQNPPGAAGAPPGNAFFTIWYRRSASEPWRYIAE